MMKRFAKYFKLGGFHGTYENTRMFVKIRQNTKRVMQLSQTYTTKPLDSHMPRKK